MEQLYYYNSVTKEYAGTDTPNGEGFESTNIPPIEKAEDESILFIDGVWIADKAEPPKEPIPETITMRQARLQLLKLDLLDDVEALLVDNREAKIEWDYASELHINHPIVQSLSESLNLTREVLETMFLDASKL